MQGVGKKLHTPLLFSAYLDMRPFLSSTVLQTRFAAKHASSWSRPGSPAGAGPGSSGSPGAGTGARGSAEPGAQAEACSLYELYAVVCHRGQLQVTCPG
jgi:ubiquitin carboxyl-terminal hydrolase 22/27/51